MDGKISDSKPVPSGLPQGSDLGPLFLLIFVYDLPSLCQNVTLLLFADVAKFISLGLAKEEFENELNVIYNWTVQINKLFNNDKCTHVSFTKSSKKFCLNNTDIKLVGTHKDLGVIITNNMSCNFAIKRNLSNLNRVENLNLFSSIIVPVVLYAIRILV